MTTEYFLLSLIGLPATQMFFILVPGGLLVEYVNLIPETCKKDPLVPRGNESIESSRAAKI